MRLLIVEDDHSVAEALQAGLAEEGHHVAVAHRAETALRLMRQDAFELVVLDLGLPGRDGMEVLRELRAEGNGVPVVILTARGELEDRVSGLQAGADDYVVKPFAFAELSARIQAIERRLKDAGPVLNVGSLSIDRMKRIVTRDGRQIDLTQRECELLIYLAERRGHVVSRDMLARDVWNVASRATPMDNVIDVHISRLRSKISEGADTSLLRTVRGVGYVLEVSE